MNDADAKKLLIVTEAVDPAETNLGFFCDWIRSLAGHPRIASVEVWCLREGPWPDRPANVRVRVLPTSFFARGFTLVWRVLTTSADTVFVHMAPVWAAWFGPWWRLTGKRVVVWYTHGSKSLALRVACAFTSTVATATDAAFPLPAVRRDVLGHGIDPAFFRAVRRPSGERVNVIGVGRLTPRKRVLETLRFFVQLREVLPNATFTWIGSPRTQADHVYAKEVIDFIQSSGLENGIQVRPGIPHHELPEMFAGSALLLHLSATGSLDKVVLEALASGCPVFSTNPATRDVAEKWFVASEAVPDAVVRAKSLLDEGVSSAEKTDIENRFALPGFIDRLVRVSLLPKA